MTEIGTLKELNVKPGDVVGVVFTWDGKPIKDGAIWKIKSTEGVHVRGVKPSYDEYHCGVPLCNHTKFRIVSRASETPKLWSDMTDAEKGALLLAHHEGKDIEVFASHWLSTTTPLWKNHYAYRVKPKRITVPLMADNKEIGTIDLVDGKPDQSSIKMGEA